MQTYALENSQNQTGQLPGIPKHPGGGYRLERIVRDPIAGRYTKTPIKPIQNTMDVFDWSRFVPGDCLKITSVDYDPNGNLVKSEHYGVAEHIYEHVLAITWFQESGEMTGHAESYILALPQKGGPVTLLRRHQQQIREEIIRLTALEIEYLQMIEAQLSLAEPPKQQTIAPKAAEAQKGTAPEQPTGVNAAESPVTSEVPAASITSSANGTPPGPIEIPNPFTPEPKPQPVTPQQEEAMRRLLGLPDDD